MKKLLYQWGAGLLFVLATLTACSDDDNSVGTEPTTPQKPTVILTAGEASFTTLSFTLQSTDSKRCAYVVLEKDQPLPDIEEVLSKGTVVDVNQQINVLVEELDVNTAYQIVAAAKGEEESVSATLAMTTQQMPLPEKRHTLIFYYMGDDTGLEEYMEANLRTIQAAAGHLIRLSDKNQVAVFYDSGKKARLTKLAINQNDRTEHQLIEEYSQEEFATNPIFMGKVLDRIKKELPADSYGLVVSSHGGGWVPLDIFDQHITAPTTRFIGQDGNEFMEIPQLVEALDGFKLEYLLFDACLMSSIEALYDLRHSADYIIASAAEVLGEGFPYKEIVPQLFQHNLKGACESFIRKYISTSGTIALIKCDKLDALAVAMKDIVTRSKVTPDITKIQGYEGLTPHLYYDLEQYAAALSKDISAFQAALKEAVVYTDHSKQFYSGYGPKPAYYELPKSCGVSCFIDSGLFPNTKEAYLQTNWAKAIGAK